MKFENNRPRADAESSRFECASFVINAEMNVLEMAFHGYKLYLKNYLIIINRH